MKRKIDVGGLSQFYTGRKELSPTMQLEYTLKEAVDPEKLQDALNRAAGVFSVFRVRIALDNRRPVYEETESVVDHVSAGFSKSSSGSIVCKYIPRIRGDGKGVFSRIR